MSEVKVNKISPRTACGTTTLGDSGDTFTIPAGVSITNSGTASGFGSTGEVSWVTTKKTTTFTATAGEGYFCDTSSGAFTVNLPAGTAGNSFAVADYTNTFQTNGLTISPNGSQKIGGVNADVSLTTEGQSAYFVYVDDTEGWKNVIDSTSNVTGNPFLIASGGTESTSGNCKIHKFTGPGTFTVSAASTTAAENVVSYMVVAGGGGGAAGCAGGGGGAGGFRELKSPLTPYTASPLDGYPSAPNRITVTAQAYTIAVGGGGPGGAAGGTNLGTSGSVSTFSTITSAGGGNGSAGPCSPSHSGGNGGSGGGGGHYTGTGGSGNTPPTTPPQGNNGANSAPGAGSAPSDSGGGGGGATTAAIQAPSPDGARDHNGGAGATTSITASPVAYAGGGGGTNRCGGGANDTDGGSGGGGKGGYGPRPGPAPQSTGAAGSDNTGGGGGGGKKSEPTGTPNLQAGGNGGSGIVVIRYKYQ